jgi:tetratricopeptide (TPR) repeat protein
VKRLGIDHPSTLTTLDNLAGAYVATNKLPEAIALFAQVRDARLKKLGADHPDTLTTMHNLAVAYQAAGKLAEAIALFKQVRETRMRNIGADHPDTLATLGSLAKAHQAAGNLDQALPLFAQAAAGIEKRGFQHDQARVIILDMIAAYEEARQFDQAEAWRRKWLTVVKQRAGADSPAYAGELAALGLHLMQQAKWSDAEAALRECVTIRQKALPDFWNTFNAMSMLGAALLGQKKYTDAEPLLVKGFEGMKQRAETIPPQGKRRLIEAVDRLIELTAATNRPADVMKWQAERKRYRLPKEPEKR